MKKSALFLTFILGLIVLGCRGRDAEVDTFIEASDRLTVEIVQKIKADPTVSGVEEAQKILDGKKTDLRSKYDALKSARGYEIKEETMKKFTDSIFKNAEAVNNLRIDYVEKSVDDAAFGKKIDKLVDDFNQIYAV